MSRWSLRRALVVVVCVTAACHHAIGDGRAGISASPVAAGTLAAAAAFQGHRIAAGEGHTCVVHPDGAVWCWGRDSIGMDRAAARPAPVIGLAGARSVFAHDGATCATTTRGLVCWVDNLFGQVRMPPTLEYRADPEPRIGADRKLDWNGALGPQGACVMRKDGGVACWGEIGTGMDLEEGTRFGVIPGAEQGKNAISGRRTTTSRRVPGIDGAVQVAFGIEHLCALMADRTVTCMGSNRVGQLGRIERDIEAFHPARPVPGLREVAQLEAGLAASTSQSSATIPSTRRRPRSSRPHRSVTIHATTTLIPTAAWQSRHAAELGGDALSRLSPTASGPPRQSR